MAWRGLDRKKGQNGQPNTARITDDDIPDPVEVTEEEYHRGLYKPPYEELRERP